MEKKLPVHRTTDWWPDFFEPFKSAGQRLNDFFSPTAEAVSSDDSYEVVVELPGVDEKDIDITLNDDVLVIRGEKHSEKEEKGKTYYFSERSYGSFQRSFRLPGIVNPDAVQASFDKGVLHINLPKNAEEATTSRKIEISKKQ